MMGMSNVIIDNLVDLVTSFSKLTIGDLETKCASISLNLLICRCKRRNLLIYFQQIKFFKALIKSGYFSVVIKKVSSGLHNSK